MREAYFDRDLAVAYARRWALGRNPAYYDFSGLGGDCTNFASQCLFAGAGIMNYTPVYGWYYRSVSDRAAAWTGVEYLYNYLTRNDSVGPYALVVDWSKALPGDLVQLGTEETVQPVMEEREPLLLERGRVGELRQEVTLEGPVQAPVRTGDRLGTLRVYLGEEVLEEIPLVAETDVPRITYGQMLVRLLRGAFVGQ